VSIIWAVLIAWTLFLVVIDHELDLESKFWKFFIYAYSIPAVLSLPPAVLGYYSKVDNAWCWIGERESSMFVGDALRLGCYYLWVWASILFTIVIYIKVMKQLRSEGTESDYTLRVELSNRLKKYPSVLIICWTVATGDRIFEFIYPN
jgi:hypothetical protein